MATAKNAQQRQLYIILGVVAVVVVAFVVVLALGNQPTSAGVDYASIPQSRTEDGAFVLGFEDAPVTLIEFADWACPHCQDYHDTMNRFITEYVATGRAKFEFRMFPTAGGQLSFFAGQVAECADDQRPGAFWEAHELMYRLATSGRYTEDIGRLVASELNLDFGTLLTCSSDATQVTDDVAFGRAREVSGTPAIRVRYNDGDAQVLVVNGTQYAGANATFDVLTQMVDQAAQNS
ncbi:MAG: DsbA family protein [Pleurocapsa minor GSE-CHR-MK-17-07R]|jgi:protein-disulfide isomerase|nr:DsbA family protein [Pleurocapsa minor GSE-CHR-MK 17-07R]